nr:ferredoxin [uncultured bacterium]BAH89949.1 ferredoxin [uncultured bacterium]
MSVALEARTFEIRVKGTQTVVPCREDEKVLTAMEHAIHFPKPRPVQVGCRNGGCGACRVKVVSGEYARMKMSRAHVTVEEEAQGYVLACRILPLSDMVIEPAAPDPREWRARRNA